jgi:hypothetical protein
MYLSGAIGSGDRYLKQPDRGISEIERSSPVKNRKRGCKPMKVQARMY